jgi:HAD superfamily hydrolase (TIGR01490 family)
MSDVAAFDFDGTLTEGGSVFGFLCAVAGRRSVLAASAGLAPRFGYAALASGTAADRTKELLFERVLAGAPLDRIEEVATAFARQHLARHGRVDVRQRFEWHRQRGDAVVIVSASPDVYLHHVGAELNADGTIGTRLAVSDQGTLTGRYQGRNCRGEEKVRRLREWIDGREGTPPTPASTPTRLWAYGNSRGDLRMLTVADVGVNVGKLGPLGRLRSFPGLAATGPGL